MLVRDFDDSVQSSIVISSFKNVDTNVSKNFSGRKWGETDCSENFIFGLHLNGFEKLGYSSDNTEEKIPVPEGYQLLSEEFFNFENIPPPLVSFSWLKLLNGDDESGEDSIPLAKLKKKIKNRRLEKNVESVLTCDGYYRNEYREKAEKIKKQKPENELLRVNRKRGRPKKHIAESSKEILDDFRCEENEHFWNYESDLSHHDTQNLVDIEIKTEKEDSDTIINSLNEHDYFKPIVNTPSVKSVKESKKERKKKRITSTQGVKIGDSKVSFPCSECGKTFSAASTLKCHQRIHNGTLLICTECHKGFVSKYLLKCHMRIHNGDLIMCHKCGRGFTTSELLKVHSRAHTGDRPFVCNVCGKSFPTSSNMLQHKQIHSSEKKFLCSKCGSSFVQKRCLDYHMLTHAEKKNICNVCGKLWARKSDLVEHMRVHTGVKPYCCTICPQKFSQASSLKRHQLVHVDVKPISCVTCNKTFKCQEYYKRHLKKHEKDYLINDI